MPRRRSASLWALRHRLRGCGASPRDRRSARRRARGRRPSTDGAASRDVVSRVADSCERQPLRLAGELLVATAYGVRRGARAGRATRSPPAPGRRARRGRRGRGSSGPPRRSRSAAPARSRGPTGAPCPGTTTVSGPDSSSTRSSDHGHSSGKQSVAVRRHPGLLDEVAGEQHVRVIEAYDEVAAGVAATRVHQLDRPVAEVDRRDRGEGAVRRDDRRVRDLLGRAGRRASSSAALRLLAGGDRSSRPRDSWAVIGTSPYSSRKARVAEGVVEVVVGVHQADHRPRREPAQVGEHLAGRLGRGVGVDDQQAGLALDHGDVDVVPLVARHPDPVRRPP